MNKTRSHELRAYLKRLLSINSETTQVMSETV